MPRFYFDVFDGDQITRDEIGIDFPDEDEAAKQAMAALSDIVHDGLPGGPQGEFWVKVRDESGAYIFAAELKFKADWL
ncbi:DUF6894 family protein [Mesorhizobium sp. IMUNJ 23232]|uniref:DUF6894 family protein n=1 Tax=Mesorhizobium sp. IMUNJ 23232 TaxID=3376064 RepID=UPI00379F5A34